MEQKLKTYQQHRICGRYHAYFRFISRPSENIGSGGTQHPLNVKKTKFTTITKSRQQQESLWIKEKVKKYEDSGRIVNENNEYSGENRTRIGQARNIFSKMKKVFCGNDLNLHLKVRTLKCYVFPVLLYVQCWRSHSIRKLQ